jgi:hypothetical protein
VSQQPRSTFVLVHPSEILAALVGLKDVVVLAHERRGPDVELMIEQVTGDVRCPRVPGTGPGQRGFAEPVPIFEVRFQPE